MTTEKKIFKDENGEEWELLPEGEPIPAGTQRMCLIRKIPKPKRSPMKEWIQNFDFTSLEADYLETGIRKLLEVAENNKQAASTAFCENPHHPVVRLSDLRKWVGETEEVNGK